MAKTRRTRRRFRRAKWSSNIQELNSVPIATVNGTWSGTATLATNPSQTTLGVSNIYTVKNFETAFTIEAAGSAHINGVESITAYIMFVPQGMNVSENYNLDHPEYIMNYKYLGSPNAVAGTDEKQNFQPYKLRTRLSRKLNTGDSIILFIKGTATGTGNLELSGLVRWWTKAN